MLLKFFKQLREKRLDKKAEIFRKDWVERHGFDAKYTVAIDKNLPFDEWKQMREWCEANCSGGAKLLINYGFFEKGNDAMMFKLTWC